MPKDINWPPKFRPAETAGSVWDKVKQGPSKSWTHWPNPFPYLRDLKVLACEDTVQLQLLFWGAVFGRWFFSNFIPSPVELTRKTVAGGYKCGFYVGEGFGSPLDIIWEDKSVSKAVLEISGPFTTTLFYLWAMQTGWSGLSAAHHAFLAVERCDAAMNECLVMNGDGDWNFSPESGSPVGFDVIYDPLHRWDGIASMQFFAGALSIHAFGYVTATGASVSSCDVYIRSAVYTGPKVHLGAFGPNATRYFYVEFNQQTTLTQDFEIRMDIVQSPTFSAHTSMHVDRFTGKFDHVQSVDPTRLLVPDPCRSRLLSPMNYLPSNA